MRSFYTHDPETAMDYAKSKSDKHPQVLFHASDWIEVRTREPRILKGNQNETHIQPG